MCIVRHTSQLQSGKFLKRGGVDRELVDLKLECKLDHNGKDPDLSSEETLPHLYRFSVCQQANHLETLIKFPGAHDYPTDTIF